LIRLLRLGLTPPRANRRFLVIQIDGLSQAVLEHALAAGRLRTLGRLLRRGRLVFSPMSVGIPTSTPAFQAGLFYGVNPDIPGFHWYDKRMGADIYFPRPGVADLVEGRHAQGQRGIMEGGSCYGCVFTGGAAESLWSLARIAHPARAGRSLLAIVPSTLLLLWVIAKCLVLTALDFARALLRLIADPVRETRRGWRWLMFKIGLSIWLRQLFTLAASADLYRGTPAIYVNFLEYDVFAHAFGPFHRRAIRALSHVDRSIAQLWRVARRLPELRYDFYVLSDHGQVPTRPFTEVSGGLSIEAVVLAAFSQSRLGAPGHHALARLAALIQTYRRTRGYGLYQRYVNYMEKDFPERVLSPEALRQLEPIRVVAAGPNAFVYFADTKEPLELAEIESRFPGAALELSRHPGVGFLLARSANGPICLYRGRTFRLDEACSTGPFADREDRLVVAEGLRDLMQMPSAGDLVIYGTGAAAGHLSYLPELGAHAGPAPEELHTFVLHPPTVTLPSPPLTRPSQLYAHFLGYREERQ
jgi:hypothetical protein